MNQNINSIATDTARIALSMMTVEELRNVIIMAADKLDEKAEHHRIAIEQAIADALDDGFDVGFWVEGERGGCFMNHEENDRIKHITVN